jgi:hypothetical protein
MTGRRWVTATVKAAHAVNIWMAVLAWQQDPAWLWFHLLLVAGSAAAAAGYWWSWQRRAVRSRADADRVLRQGDRLLRGLHDPAACEGRACVIHRPSAHHMRAWPLVWRADRQLMERTCPHGIGHPDPDDVAYRRDTGTPDPAVHGCDGCCREPVREPVPVPTPPPATERTP